MEMNVYSTTDKEVEGQDVNVYSTTDKEVEGQEVNLGEKWARRPSVLLAPDSQDPADIDEIGATKLVIDEPPPTAAANSAKNATGRAWYKHPAFFGGVIICVLVAIIVPVVLVTTQSSNAMPNLGPSTYQLYESCEEMQAASERDFSGRGSYSYWHSAWQDIPQYGCCDALAADRRSCDTQLQYPVYAVAVMADSAAGSRSGSLKAGVNSPDSNSQSGESGSGSASQPASDVSGTNNQVEGVDEPDIVKNDGTYIYSISNRAKLANNNTELDNCSANLVIAEAFPVANAKVVSRVSLQGLKVYQMYLQDDILLLLGLNELVEQDRYSSSWDPSNFTMEVWNITDRTMPRRVRRLEITGSYVDARLVKGVAYVVLYDWSREVPLMSDTASSVTSGFLPATGCDTVGYVSTVRQAGFTTILTLPLDINTVETVALGKQVLAFTVGNVYANKEYLVLAASDYNNMQSIAMIFKLGLNSVSFTTIIGGIPGTILNQFSMDIYEGNLRVATTVHSWAQRRNNQRPTDTGDNNLYIYGIANGKLVGSVEGLAAREEIKSARFVNERVYIVTFRKTDPLFVIDASDPTEPQVLGFLKIPGFSEYLHPIGTSRLIGVGRDADEETGRRRGVKLSLFDNSDPYNPKETYNIIIGNQFTRSEVDESHHAFRYIEKHNVIVVPILFTEGEYGDAPSKQGAYVYRIGATAFELVRILTHFDDKSLGDAAWLGRDTGDNGWQWRVYPGNVVRRSVTLDDYLYTVSNNKIGIVDMSNGFADLGSVDLR